MRKVLINYADGLFAKSQQLNTESGLTIAGFQQAFAYQFSDIDRRFLAENRWTLTRSKGAGYWLWKPYFILKTLQELSAGDILFYCDAGASFINSIDPLVEVSIDTGQDIIPFDVGLTEKLFTKRDAFILMDCDKAEYSETSQRQASFILFRKSPMSMEFAREYLSFGTDIRILSDIPNEMGLPNYPGFVAHRHDQSIFSLLSKKYQLKAHRDPSQWGNGGEDKYPDSRYGQLIDHTRKRNISIPSIGRKYVQIAAEYFGFQKPDKRE